MSKQIVLLFFFITTSLNIYAQDLILERLDDISFNQPVDLVTTYMENDDRLFVLEKPGRIHILFDALTDSPSQSDEPFLDLTDIVDDRSEGGLLGMAFHPDYASNGYFFVNYTFVDETNDDQFSTRISRFTTDPADPSKALKDSELDLITVPQPAGNHDGGDLVFGPDGYLYIALGDGGASNDFYNNGQNGKSYLGAISRVDVDQPPYAVPADNPYVSDTNVLDEIWSIGWRNPWRMAFDPITNDLWIGDVGQNEIEEIDVIPAGMGGLNYGWPCYEGTSPFRIDECDEGEELVEPIFEYNHDLGQISVTGGYVYRGEAYPGLYGKYIFTDYGDSQVFWITDQMEDGSYNTTRINIEENPKPSRVATFGETWNRELFFATLFDGNIWRIKSSLVATEESPSNINVTLRPNPVQDSFTLDGEGTIEIISIVDIKGKKFEVINKGKNTYSASHLENGTYILKISNGKSEGILKMVKMNR